MTARANQQTTTSATQPTSALSGTRILDFTRHIAGPCATQMLADFGADVIKVESLPHGDGLRRTGTVFNGSESGMFLIANHGKRSLAIDMRNPEAAKIIKKLIADSDVLIENFRPGVASSLGISYEYCREINPRLIYASISAFGQEGPLSRLPGTDPVVQAMSGIMSVTGEPGAGPVLVGVPIADFSAAMLAVQAVLMALLAREKTGRGQKIELAMISALIYSWTTRLASYWGDGKDPVANGAAHSVVAPYEAYATADGYAVAGVWGAGEAWPRFCHAVDRADLIEDPRFDTNVKRVADRAELNSILNPIFKSRKTTDWAERFAKEKALFGPVYSFSEVIAHPQIELLGLFKKVDHPTLGPIQQLGPAYSLSDTPGRITRPPPLLGEHTSEILREVNFSEREILGWSAKGVIKDALARDPAEEPGVKNVAGV